MKWPALSFPSRRISAGRNYWPWAIMSALAVVIGVTLLILGLGPVSSSQPGSNSSALVVSAAGTFVVCVIGTIVSLLITFVLTSRTGRLRELNRALKLTMNSPAHQRAEAERRLRLMSKIIENSPIAITNFRILGSQAYPEPPVLDFLSSNFDRYGYQAEDLLSGKIDFFRDVIHTHDQARVLVAIAEAVRQGLPEVSEEFRIVRPDGVVRWTDGRMRFERDPASGALYGHGILRDFTELKEAEIEMRRLDDLLTAQFDNCPNGIIVIDTTAKTTKVNSHYATMWSMPSSFVESPNYDDAVAAIYSQLKDPGPWLASVRRAEASPDARFDEELELKDGRVYERQSGPIRDLAGAAHGRVIFFRDITERKRVDEDRLRLSHLIDLARDAIIVRDEDGAINYWNEGAERMYGWSKSEALGQVSQTLLKTQLSNSLPDITADVLRDGSWEGELIHTCRDGRRIEVASRWLLDSGSNGHSATSQILEINSDITNRKRAEEALQQSERRFHAVADTAQDAIIMIDSAARICYWNRAAGTILGYSEAEALGRNIHDWLAPASFRDAAVEGMTHFARNGDGPILGTVRELAAIRKDGVEIPVELSVAAIEIAGERYAVGIMRDISQRKAVERILKQERDFSAALLDSMPGILLVIDAAGRCALERQSVNLDRSREPADSGRYRDRPLRRSRQGGVRDEHACGALLGIRRSRGRPDREGRISP